MSCLQNHRKLRGKVNQIMNIKKLSRVAYSVQIFSVLNALGYRTIYIFSLRKVLEFQTVHRNSL